MLPQISHAAVGLLAALSLALLAGVADCHKTRIMFTAPFSSDTHQANPFGEGQSSAFGAEAPYTQTTSIPYHSGAPPADRPHIAAESPAHNHNNAANFAAEKSGKDPAPQAPEVSKQELSNAAVKLQDEVAAVADSRDTMQEIERKEQELSDKLRDTNYERLNELVKQRNALLNKIAAVGKTLRKEHDALRPELREQPILIIAKTADDERRKANQLAHIEGFEDFVNHITSPCESMEELRQKSHTPKSPEFKTKFETEQKILDSMNLEERLNYDRNMIEHYEAIMQEIEQGIRNAEEEIQNSWNHPGD